MTGVAFVASVSVGLFAGFEHFSLFGRAKIEASAKKYECASPNSHAVKKRKMPRTGGKTYGNACYAGYDRSKVGL